MWVDVLDTTQDPENFDQESVKGKGCDIIARLIVGKLGGQFWQLSPGGSHIALPFLPSGVPLTCFWIERGFCAEGGSE